jgi:hypothetical protein
MMEKNMKYKADTTMTRLGGRQNPSKSPPNAPAIPEKGDRKYPRKAPMAAHTGIP